MISGRVHQQERVCWHNKIGTRVQFVTESPNLNIMESVECTNKESQLEKFVYKYMEQHEVSRVQLHEKNRLDKNELEIVQRGHTSLRKIETTASMAA